MPIYNCKHSGDQYSITKFNRHGEVESSYLCDHVQCQCPAGVRDTCRHRLMLSTFLEHSLVNTNLFLDWDNGRRIVDFNGLPATVRSNGDGLQILKDYHDLEAELVAPAAGVTSGPSDLAPQALTDTCTSTPAHDLLNLPSYHGVTIKEVDQIQPASPSITPATPQWRRW